MTRILLIFITCTLPLTAQDFSKGVLDLSDYTFDEKKVLSLEGEVLFHWGELVPPNQAFWGDPEMIHIPGTWNNQPRKAFPGMGQGTYAFTINLPSIEEPWMLHLGDTASAMALYINGELLYQSGKMSQGGQKEVPLIKPAMVYLGYRSGPQNVVIQVTNESHYEGGIWYPYILGSARALSRWQNGAVGYDLFIMGLLVSIGIFYSLLSLKQRFPVYLYFGLFCLALAIRSGLTQQRVFYDFLPVSWSVLHRLEYLLNYAGLVLFVGYTGRLFPFLPGKIKTSVLWGAGLLSLSLLVPGPLYTGFLLFFQWGTVAAALGILVSLLRHWNRDPQRIKRYLGGFILFIGAVINDFFFLWQMTPYALIFFVFIQSALLSRDMVSLYKGVNRMTKSMLALNKAFFRFLPHPFFDYLGKKDIKSIHLGDHVNLDLYLLYMDIRSFTDMAEKQEAQETFTLLNDYWGRIGPILREHGGWIERYIGDAVLAFFETDSRQVLEAAIQIQGETTRMNREEQYPIRVGIALHKGPLVLGMVGEEERIQGTVIGNPATVVTQVEAYSKKLSAPVVVTESFFQDLEDPTVLNYLFFGQVVVAGQEEPLGLYGFYHPLFDEDFSLRDGVKKDFERGVLAFHQREFHQALVFFNRVLDIQPAHDGAGFYKRASLYYRENPPEEDWRPGISLKP